MDIKVEFIGNGKYGLVTDKLFEGPLDKKTAIEKAKQLINVASELFWAHDEYRMSNKCDEFLETIEKEFEKNS